MADAPLITTRRRSKPDEKPALNIVVDANKAALRGMRPYMSVWRDAIRAFSNKGLVQDPYRVNIKVGRLISDTETVIPRDAMALLGSTPYMPIRAAKDFESSRAEAMVDLVDHFTNKEFFAEFCDALKIARALGIAYIEPRWKYWPVGILKRNIERDPFGRIVGLTEIRTQVIKEGMEWVVHGPEAIRPHPHGNSLRKKPWIVIAEKVPVSEIIRLLDDPFHPYKLKTGDRNALRTGEPEDKDALNELNVEREQFDDSIKQDIGILLRYYQNPTDDYPAGRWIHVFNFKHVLLDDESMAPNMPLDEKPVAPLRNISHIGPDRYWPIGMYEFTRDLARWGDKILSMYFDQVLQNSAQWVAYNPDIVSREDLIAQPGQRIPVPGGRFSEALLPMKVGQADDSLFSLYNITDDKTDNRLGLFEYQRGSSPPRKETATTTNRLSDAGNTRLEFGVLQMEQGGLASTGYLTYKEVEANVTDGTKAEILGPERASAMGSADPDTLQGGFVWNFQGSTRIKRKAQKMETLIEIYNMTRNQETIASGQGAYIMDRRLLEESEAFTREELNNMGLTPEGQMQQQQQQMMQQQMQGGMPPEQAPPVSESTAVQNPNAVGTPATNMETRLG